MTADHYAVLGVSREATPDEIKRAYRKLAREWHPDANRHDPAAEERFKQIAHAYDVLSDPEKRRRYDAFGDAGAAGAPFQGFGDFGDIMDAFFGGSPFGGARTQRRTSAVGGQDLVIATSVTLEEAVFGTKRTVEFDAATRCERCAGDGCEPGTFRTKCARCGGQGEVRSTRQTILGTVMTSRPCGTCGGAGESPAVPCTACRGQGRARGHREVTVDIPRGVSDGTTLRVRGRGEEGTRGGPDGDLFVRIGVEPHEVFDREGDNLVCDLVISMTQAVLGAEIPLETLDGPETVRVPPGTQHGTVIALRGKGASRLDGRGRGDLLVHVSVVIPSHLKTEERALVEHLAELRGESVTGEQRGIFRRLRDTILGE